MRIAFYMPFKPLDHPHPSGDLVIGSQIIQFLRRRGHTVYPVSRLRARWIYWKPWQWIRLGAEVARIRRRLPRFQPHLWLTYHAYYKAPDLLGPCCAHGLGIPYAVFQGVYATKYRRRAVTRPGFYLNRHALLRADAVFTNKRRDEINLRRLLPESRLHYIAPGIQTRNYRSGLGAGDTLRRSWGGGSHPIILTAAMFRPGVKTEGLAAVIAACGRIAAQGQDFLLVVCGDGAGKASLQELAQRHLGNRAHFCGQIPRDQMAPYYRSADLFVFPGIREGLGMVYLEAQAAGVPVVACRGWGASEVVRHNVTGLLSPPGDWEQFEGHIMRLLRDRSLRTRMGAAAQHHTARHHDLDRNYGILEAHLQQLVDRMVP